MNFIFDIDRPIYIQLVEQLKMYIINEELKLGTRLPSVRDFALQAKVNPNTMQKALVELENEGLIYTERTNGKFVTENREIIEKTKQQFANQMGKKYLNSMRNIGITKEQAIKYLEKLEEEN